MKVISVIPARMGSTRFPGKPLADICGMPMIGHVYNRTNESKLVDKTYIATCDQEIKDYADSINAPCIMTSSKHERCSDRTAEAMLKIERETGEIVDIIVMVQGDEPMISGRMIDTSIEELLKDTNLHAVNLMSEMFSAEEFNDPNEIKVVVGKDNNALYFSREPIPSIKKYNSNVPMYKQVCVIPFRRQSLVDFNEMEPTPLEEIESIDMLRFLENNKPVRMVCTSQQTFSVDTIYDIEKVRACFREQSEKEQV